MTDTMFINWCSVKPNTEIFKGQINSFDDWYDLINSYYNSEPSKIHLITWRQWKNNRPKYSDFDKSNIVEDRV